MDPFQMALDAMFQAPGSLEAVYSGVPDPVRVIRQQPTEDLSLPGGDVVSDSDAVMIRRSEAPSPAAGETISIGSLDFVIAGVPRLDLEGLTWTCELVPA